MRKLFVAGGLALATLAVGATALAEGDTPPLKKVDWSFDGPFGTYDRAAAQRGFQVYKEVCSACHGLSLVAYRNLQELGLSENAVKGIAADVQIKDIGEDGSDIDRPGKPSDRFRKPFPNEAAARAANNGAYPPDLSLITKAREGHEDYVYSLLQGFDDVAKLADADKKALGLAKDFKVSEGMFFNRYYPGHQIKMQPPLAEDRVSYTDGTKASVEQMSRDVTTFLAWAAEPRMEDRKRTGIRVLIFLIVLAGIMYVIKERVWANAH